MIDQPDDHIIERRTKRLLLNATSLIFLFILYASLLPYNISANASGVSFQAFIDVLRFSSMNAEQGQWIAHVIFNILLTFTGSLYCQVSSRKNILLIMYVSILGFGFLIEYLQMFVGNRGSSLVDVYANIAGIFIGFIGWKLFGNFTLRAVKYFYKYGTLEIGFVKKLYLAFVIAIILFPFDFFINGLQFQVAFATKGMPLFENNTAVGIGTISLLAAAILLFPLGVLYKLGKVSRRKSSDAPTIIKFALLLLLLEILQFFELSGQSSFLSYICKIIGFCAGYYLAGFFNLRLIIELVLKMRITIFMVLPFFMWAVLKIKGVSITFVGSFDDIMTVIGNTSFLPFNYYINVGSGEALLSFLLTFIVFMPIGAALAVHNIYKGTEDDQSISKLSRIGVLCSIMLEIIVLVWGLKRPDVTNVLLAAMALPLGYQFVLMTYNSVKIPEKN